MVMMMMMSERQITQQVVVTRREASSASFIQATAVQGTMEEGVEETRVVYGDALTRKEQAKKAHMTHKCRTWPTSLLVVQWSNVARTGDLKFASPAHKPRTKRRQRLTHDHTHQ
jgi:hypothetical protein